MAILDPRRRRRSTLILLVLTSITLLTLDYQGFRPLGVVADGVRAIVSPLAGGADSVTSPFTNAWRSFTEFDDMEAEIDRLQDELAQLQGQAIEASAAEESLRVLLEEVEIDYVGGAEVVVAQVLSRPSNFVTYSIELDKGADDGIREGMPVLTSGGLAGQVIEVQGSTSEVRLLHADTAKLGVRIVGTGDIALAEGQGIGEPLEIVVPEGSAEEFDVTAGLPVVTSGIDGSSYPPDIPVGVVEDVAFDPSSLEVRIEVRPVADLEDLRFATVILWTVDGESAP